MKIHVKTNTDAAHLQCADTVVRTLAYHEVTTTGTPYRYGISTDKFEDHLRRLQQFRQKADLPAAQPYITFDDGHLSQLMNAQPMLHRFGEHAIFFVTAGWTSKRAGYMTWRHLRELQACGHEVQSHGWSHTLLTRCSPHDLERELVHSKNALEEHLGTKVDGISFPGGRWNPQVLHACVMAGYSRVFTSDPWHIPSSCALPVIGRWMVSGKMNGDHIATLLRGRGAVVHLLRTRHRFKELAKSVIGDRAYQEIWNAISNKKYSLENMEHDQDLFAERKA